MRKVLILALAKELAFLSRKNCDKFLFKECLESFGLFILVTKDNIGMITVERRIREQQDNKDLVKMMTLTTMYFIDSFIIILKIKEPHQNK